jgi:hypothetical protein
MNRASITTAAKQLAQDASSTGVSVQLLIASGDYSEALDQALRILGQDRPNLRVVDHVVTTAGFRFVLAGDGAILPQVDQPAAPTASLAGLGAGNVDNGTHSYVVVCTLPWGITVMSPKSNVVTVTDKATNGQVNVALALGPTGTTVRTAYRTVAGDTGDWKLVGSVANNLPAQTVVDNLADSGLGASASARYSLDAWIDGASQMHEIWWPYDATIQGDVALDDSSWRVLKVAGAKIVLEFLFDTPGIGQTVRLIYATPYLMLDTPDLTSVPAGLEDALVALDASLILTLAANKAVQNTGNTGLPNDVVDRRSQSDQFRSAAKALFNIYAQLVGKPGTEGSFVQGASGFKDLDVMSGTGRGFLWHPAVRR